jgi:hypothetical protein
MPTLTPMAIADAARNADWGQVVMNGGPPCFHVDPYGFCLRAERWAGHGDSHPFVSLADLLAACASPVSTATDADVERAARALEAVLGERTGYGTWETVKESSREMRREEVRTVVRALSERAP